MTDNCKLYLLFVLAGVGVTTACSTTDRAVGLRPEASLSIAASSISVHYLPQPEGIVVYEAGLSAGGMIFGRTSSANAPVRPFVWTSPYATPAAEIAAEGFAGGLDDPNDNGDIRGSLNGAGFWAHNALGWQFSYVDCGVYVSVSVASVNNSRFLVGWGSVNGVQKALYWSNELDQPNELPIPPLAGTLTGARALAVNNNGDVVGEVREQRSSGRKVSDYSHAVIWKRGAVGWEANILNDVGTTNIPYDINDIGQVAGNANTYTAVLWTPSNGVYGNATTVSTSQGALTKVDRCGRVIGYTHTNTPNKRRAWVWENGATTELPFPPATVATSAMSITTELTTGKGIILGAGMPTGSQNFNASFVPVRWEIPGCP